MGRGNHARYDIIPGTENEVVQIDRVQIDATPVRALPTHHRKSMAICAVVGVCSLGLVAALIYPAKLAFFSPQTNMSDMYDMSVMSDMSNVSDMSDTEATSEGLAVPIPIIGPTIPAPSALKNTSLDVSREATLNTTGPRPDPRYFRSDGRCGPAYPSELSITPGGPMSACDPTAFANEVGPCCSNYAYCGDTVKHCECPECTDYSKMLDFPTVPADDIGSKTKRSPAFLFLLPPFHCPQFGDLEAN